MSNEPRAKSNDIERTCRQVGSISEDGKEVAEAICG